MTMHKIEAIIYVYIYVYRQIKRGRDRETAKEGVRRIDRKRETPSAILLFCLFTISKIKYLSSKRGAIKIAFTSFSPLWVYSIRLMDKNEPERKKKGKKTREKKIVVY
jgi:hypothetical protein